MNLDSLTKLYVHELKDLYSAEKQLVELDARIRVEGLPEGVRLVESLPHDALPAGSCDERALPGRG